jgi:hypothetical protein
LGKRTSALETQIAQLQGQIDALLQGQGGTQDWAKYLTDNPDVAAEYARLTTAKGGAEGLTSLGITSADQFGRWHYQTHGQAEGRSVTTTGGPEDETRRLIDTLTSTANNQLTALQAGNQQLVTSLTAGFNTQLDELRNQNATLTTAITGQADGFAKSQADLLEKMTAAQAQTSQELQGALREFTKSGERTGQQSKKPNYARALATNKALNSGGLSSTMLTGAGGVPNTSLTLGRTSLLGA